MKTGKWSFPSKTREWRFRLRNLLIPRGAVARFLTFYESITFGEKRPLQATIFLFNS
jgi:hypothetical protein